VAHVLGYQMAGRHTEQGVALYLDWEDEEEAFERILWEVSRGYELEESARVYWRRMKAPLAGDVPFVSSLIDRLGVTLLVIDSATRAMGAAGDHGTYESTAVSFAEAIRALGKVTTLIVDHVDGAAVKEGGVSKKAYGSIHKLNFVRNAWSLTPDDEAGGQTVGWTHAKVNHGPKLPQFGIQYQRDPVMGSLELVPVDGASVPSIAATMSIASRAAALLSDRGVLSVKDITDELMGSTERKDTETVRKALRRAEGRLFRSYSDGTWSLRNWTPAAPKARREDAPDLRIVEDEQPDELPF
jgi:hypothetical protein